MLVNWHKFYTKPSAWQNSIHNLYSQWMKPKITAKFMHRISKAPAVNHPLRL